jgi:hypothetical protein
VKAAALVLGLLLMFSRQHVTLLLAGGWRAVPVPVLAAVVIAAALAALTWLIVRKVARDGRGPIPCIYWSVSP